MGSKKSKHISLKLFLDGVETRVIGATVNQQPNKPDTARIKLPPHPVIEGIKEKTLVHLFYNDDKQSDRPKDKRYKLLFEGQVAGTQSQISQSGQSKVIKAESMGGLLTQTKVTQTFLSSPNGFNINQADIRKKTEGNEDVEFADKQGLGGEIRSQIKQELLEANKLTDGAHTMMEIIFQHNSFLRDVMRRLRILDRFPELDEDSQLEIDSFIKQDNASRLIQNAYADVQSQYSVLSLINKILGIFYYSLNMNSSVLNTFNPVPRLYNSPPPSCNILTPNDFGQIQFTENHKAKPTRVALSVSSLGVKSAYIWPQELKQPLNFYGRDNLSDHENFEKLFTPEELVKGPRPYTPSVKYKVAKGQENQELERKFYMNKARHHFNIARRRSNNLNVSGGFNPEAFPGFTTFVVAPSVDVIFGTMSAVTHSIDNQNNTATTQYQIGMPYKLLTNPDALTPPENNPSLNMGDEDSQTVPIDKVNNIYNATINDGFENNAKGTQAEVATLSVTQKHIEKYFNNRFDKDKYKDNPVLKRAVVAMGQYLDPNSYIGKSPGDKLIKEVESGDNLIEIAQDTPYNYTDLAEASPDIDDPSAISVGDEVLKPDGAVGGRHFRRRGHPNIEMVFKYFYKANKINKGNTDTNGDIWDLFNSEGIEYLKHDLEEKQESVWVKAERLKGEIESLRDELEKKYSDEEELSESAKQAKQDLESRIESKKKIRESLREEFNELDEQIIVAESDSSDLPFHDDGELGKDVKPVLLKTEYPDYDLKSFLQKRQQIIISYNRQLTKSDGGIVGNLNLFENEILEDDDDDESNG